MKSFRSLLLLGLPLVSSCDTPTYSMAGSSATNPPIASATVASTGGPGGYKQTLPAPDGQLLYQSTAQDAFGRSTHTGIIQQRGDVVEEVYIGNQPVYPGQPLYPARVVDGVIQPGYVPAGTSMVYDPVTGRTIPVRRR